MNATLGSKKIAVDFDTAAKKAARGSIGHKNGQITAKAKKVWSDAQSKSRAGLGWGAPKMAE